jgi:hypothetical protein
MRPSITSCFTKCNTSRASLPSRRSNNGNGGNPRRSACPCYRLLQLAPSHGRRLRTSHWMHALYRISDRYFIRTAPYPRLRLGLFRRLASQVDKRRRDRNESGPSPQTSLFSKSGGGFLPRSVAQRLTRFAWRSVDLRLANCWGMPWPYNSNRPQ